MRHVITTLLSFLISYGALFAKEAEAFAHNRTFGVANAVIFVENGITFSIYPDGEFDFFIDNPAYVGAAYHSNGVNISFNAGYNYSPWVQYDDYGAVIQIENTPIYYDFYGRINRIGGINVYYNGGRLARVGGLYLYYNPYGQFNRFRGYVNVYNRHFVYRPVYDYFVRPAVGLCLVNPRPYRRYYQPVRYTYYRPYRNNYRRAHAHVGRTYHYKDANPRRNVYRNDRRVVRRNDVKARNDVRNRSLGYVNARGYNKNKAYRGSNGKRVKSKASRGYTQQPRSRNNNNVARNGKRYNAAASPNRKVVTTRSTTVKRPGKTVTKTTRVSRAAGPKKSNVNRSYNKGGRDYRKAENRSKSYSRSSKPSKVKRGKSTGRSSRTGNARKRSE